MNTPSERVVFWASGLVVVFFLSLVLWWLQPQKYDRRIYLFPNHYVSGVGTESRILPAQPDYESSVELFVREYMLGPHSNRLFRLFPLSTRLKSIFLADSVLYVDLNYHSIRKGPEDRIDLAAALRILKEGVVMNFGDVKDVVVTVEGRMPDLELLTTFE